MEKQIYIIRHAETELNNLQIVQGSGINSSLNDTGKMQSLAFYKRYKNTKFDFVYCSALKRTFQTVHHFLLDGIPYKSLPELNEMSWGDHEGQSPNQILTSNYKKVVSEWLAGNYHAKLPNAESPLEMHLRLNKAIEELKSNPHKKILVCTHGRAYRCLMTILNNEPLHQMEKYHHSNTGLTIVKFENDKFEIILSDDTNHLQPAIAPLKNW